MHRRTKALAIPPMVKAEVWERDNGHCVLCGNPQAAPCAHFISRAQGGLGIPENIVTLCGDCHRRYDQTVERDEIRRRLKSYLSACYHGWDEENLIHRKWNHVK